MLVCIGETKGYHSNTIVGMTEETHCCVEPVK